MPNSRITTCCYCGTRAALVLRGKILHELSCSNCGAPLRDLKMMPVSNRAKEPAKPAPRHVRTQRSAKPRYKPRHGRYNKRKKRDTWLADVFEDAWDVVEDIFD